MMRFFFWRRPKPSPEPAQCPEKVDPAVRPKPEPVAMVPISGVVYCCDGVLWMKITTEKIDEDDKKFMLVWGN